MSHNVQPNLDKPAQPGKQHWQIVVLCVAGVIIVLAVMVFTMPTSLFPLTGVAPAPTPVKDWQTYRDPGGHFTMRMPADWQEVETDPGSTGFAGASFQMTTYWFGPHSLDVNHINFSVNIMPIQTPKQRSAICLPSSSSDLENEKRQIGHITAHSSDLTHGLGFDSQNAAFSLNYDYPGLSGGIDNGGPRPPATPVTAAQTQAYHTIIETILDSFTALPDAPLAC